MRFGPTPSFFSNVFGPATGFAWRGHAKAWKMHQRMTRRATRWPWRWRSPLQRAFGLAWGLLWIAVLVWLATGGPEARHLFTSAFYWIGDSIRDVVVNLFGLMQ